MSAGIPFRPLRLFRLPFVQGLALPVALVLAWELLSRRGGAWAYAFVPVGEIRDGFVELIANGELAANFSATLATALTGLSIGGAAGLATGALMGVSRIADVVIGPLYHLVRQVPLLGWIPLIGLWFGNGAFSKNLIVSAAVFYPMVLNTFEGIRNVEPRHLEVARVLGLGPWQRFRRVMLPHALPSIATGAANALAFAWIATVGSELLFSTGPGLGGLMQVAQAASRMDVVIVCIAAIGIVGFGMNFGIGKVSKWLLRWRNVR